MLPGGPKYRGGGGSRSFGKVPKLDCFFFGAASLSVLGWVQNDRYNLI